MGQLSPIDDGARCVLTGTTSNPAMYAGEWLAAIPIPFQVTGGPELRAAVAAVSARLTAALDVAQYVTVIFRAGPSAGWWGTQ